MVAMAAILDVENLPKAMDGVFSQLRVCIPNLKIICYDLSALERAREVYTDADVQRRLIHSTPQMFLGDIITV